MCADLSDDVGDDVKRVAHDPRRVVRYSFAESIQGPILKKAS